MKRRQKILVICTWLSTVRILSPYMTSAGRGLTLDVNYTSSSGVYDKATQTYPDIKKEGWLIYSLTGFYAVTDQLTLLLTLPYDEKTNLDYDASSGTTPGQQTDGIGDVTLSGRYTFFMRHTLESTLVAGAVAGVKFPTGSTHILDYQGNPVDRHVLPGTGSFDFPIGLSGAYTFGGKYQLTADVVYLLTTEGNWNGDPHRYGNSLNYNVKGFYKVLPNEPGEKSLFGYIGASGDTMGKETGVRASSGYSNVVNDSSGGTVLFWNVGLYANLSASTILNLGFAKAFYRYMNYSPNFDTDPAENYKIDFSITYLF